MICPKTGRPCESTACSLQFCSFWSPDHTPAMGWQCPRCGRCYGPYVAMCGYCGPNKIVTSGVGPP